MSKSKIDWNIVMILTFFILAILAFSFLLSGCLKEEEKEIVTTEKIIPIPEEPEFSNCNYLCDSRDYDYGYSLIESAADECKPGELHVDYGYPGKELLLVCCCGDYLDTDGDGFSDDEETAAGTDPNDPHDFPGSEEETATGYTCGLNGLDEYCTGTCPSTHPECVEIEFYGYPDRAVHPEYYTACACINTATEEVHPDWKPDGTNHYPKEEIIPDISLNCLDGDAHLPLVDQMKTKSFCTDDFGTTYDFCRDGMNVDLYCVTTDGSYECTDATARNCESYCGSGSICIDGACTTPIDYYDVTGADYWIHYDYLANGAPARMRGKFVTWNFITSSSGTGSEIYSDIRVSFGGKQITISTQGGTKFDYNLDSFINQFDGMSGTIKFESLFSSGYVRDKSEYSGTVDMS